MNVKMTVMSASVLMALSAGAAHAVYTPIVTTTNNNFTMISKTGTLTGGTNDVTFTWNKTLYYSVAAANAGGMNATIASPTKFFAQNWVAHDVHMFGQGTYTINANCLANNAATACALATATSYTFTVLPGQIGAHMLFDWGAPSTATACGKVNCNIDVINLWKMNDSWANANGTSAVFYTAAPNAAANTKNTVWNTVSIDTAFDADSFAGTQMIDGAFMGQSANFNMNGVPVPAAAWLLGSGLLGLVGVARRKAA